MIDAFDLCVALAPSGDFRAVDAFRQRLVAARWPFGPVEMRPALDPALCVPPGSWEGSAEAWARLQTHARVLEDAVSARMHRILIVETEVAFSSELRSRWVEIVEQAGEGWSLIRLFGGSPDTPLAYAVQGPAITRLYRALREPMPSGGVLSRMETLRGRVRHSAVEVAHHRPPVHTVPYIAVVGLHRSGSSCLAGVLHHLGVHLGAQLGGYEDTGGFEDRALMQLCEQAMPFPGTDLRLPRPEIRARFEVYARGVQRAAAARGAPAGGKYPHLCALGDVLVDVLGDALRVVHIDRPLADSTRSLVARSTRLDSKVPADAESVRALQAWLWEQKRAFLDSQPHVTVDFRALRADPEHTIRELVHALGLAPTAEQLAAAIAHVEPDRPAHDGA